VQKALANHTVERASAALRSGECACLPEIVRLMRTLSSDSSGISVDELAEVVEKDAVVLAKVIGAANTFGYNPGAVPVTSVRQAIHVIGYERIRSLAMSLLLLEQTARTRSLAERREAAVLALTSGCLAQSIASSRPMINPDEAFVCASLRHFGRIVMAMCMLDEFHQAEELREVCDDDEAYRQVFGLTPLQLSHQLLKASDLPEEILVTLQDLPASALASLEATPDAQLLALTDFAAKLSSLALKADLSAAEFTRRSHALATSYAKQLPALDQEIVSLLKSAGQQLDDFVRVFRLTSLPAESLARVKLRSAGLDPAASRPDPAPRTADQATSTGDASVALANVPQPATVVSDAADEPAGFGWQTEIDRVSALGTSPSATPQSLMRAVLESLRRGFDAPESLLFCPPMPGADHRLVHGYGVLFNRLRARARVRPEERTVFGVCLTRRENVVIHHAADPKIGAYLPEWLREPLALGAFVLLPIAHAATVHGIVLVGWPEARQITIRPEHLRMIRTLLSVVGERRSPVVV
jgi:HD-like signal output (HDOD) protein